MFKDNEFESSANNSEQFSENVVEVLDLKSFRWAYIAVKDGLLLFVESFLSVDCTFAIEPLNKCLS